MVGQLLVAAPSLKDADFAHSVILLIQYDPQSAVGLVLNHPTDIPVSEQYPELKSARPIHFWAGGPIAIGVRALLRSHDSQPVEVVTNRQLLAKLIKDNTPSSTFRVYAGYCGWSAAQLQDEVHRGLWRVRPPDPAAVFDPHPDTLWQRLTAARK